MILTTGTLQLVTRISATLNKKEFFEQKKISYHNRSCCSIGLLLPAAYTVFSKKKLSTLPGKRYDTANVHLY